MSRKQTDYCRDCDKACCKYFTVPLDEPEDDADLDAMVWYLLHEGVSIFIDDEGDWYVNVAARCRQLGADGLCGMYRSRPQICRDHTDEVCEKNDKEYDFKEHFFTVRQLKAYARKHLGKPTKKKARKAVKDAGRARDKTGVKGKTA
jgi:Fe-S-cluster containining protein